VALVNYCEGVGHTWTSDLVPLSMSQASGISEHMISEVLEMPLRLMLHCQICQESSRVEGECIKWALGGNSLEPHATWWMFQGKQQQEQEQHVG